MVAFIYQYFFRISMGGKNMKKPYVKKMLIIATIFLLISLSIAQIINANIYLYTSLVQNRNFQNLTWGEFYRVENMKFPMKKRWIKYNGNINNITQLGINDPVEQVRHTEEELSKRSNYIDDGISPSIYIEGNENFTHENGVTTGNGTEVDPYIIKDWVIVGDGSTENGIFINNTDAYFVIRNCTITQFTGSHYSGIKFNNVENGEINSSYCFCNYYGIYIRQSSHITIINSKSYDNVGWYAKSIFCYRSSNITITSCECYNNSGNAAKGIQLDDTSFCFIENTRCYNNYFPGIDIGSYSKDYPVRYITIKNCIVFNNLGGGIDMGATYRSWSNRNGYFHITGCHIYNNGHVPDIPNAFPGLFIGNVNYVIVENCHFHHNGWGIDIMCCSNSIIRNCSVHHHWEDGGYLGVGMSLGGWIAGLMFSRNNTIENCDIYDNPIGIWLDDTFKATVKNNNISHNNVTGIMSNAWNLITTARIKNNNIYGNGWWQIENASFGLTAMRSILDIRDNWWGAEDGPHTKFHSGNGDYLEWRFSVLIKRPWEQKPISYAGVN